MLLVGLQVVEPGGGDIGNGNIEGIADGDTEHKSQAGLIAEVEAIFNNSEQGGPHRYGHEQAYKNSLNGGIGDVHTKGKLEKMRQTCIVAVCKQNITLRGLVYNDEFQVFI